MGKGSRSSAGALTYADAGVDIDAGERAAALIKPLAASTRRPEVVGGVGFFGGLFQLGGYANPVLVSSTDSVGTKVLLAIQMGRFDTIGVDLVNHCVNDIFVGGAEPLFFLDYIGLGKLDPEQVERLVMGVASACRDNNCALVGGETAELPDLYKRGDFDLVGFIVGAVERERVIDGSAIQRGDAILGLPSSGLHTNGYTLARRALGTDDDPSRLAERHDALGGTLGEALLEPHRSYMKPLRPALEWIRGMAHITGGGLPGNVPRVLPAGLAARFDRSAWEVPEIFRMIQRAGGVPEEEMWRAFNMGIGMAVFTAPEQVGAVLERVPEAFPIGEVVEQRGSERVLLD